MTARSRMCVCIIRTVGRSTTHPDAAAKQPRFHIAARPQTADLVLDVPAHGHEPGSRDEYHADLLTFLALNFDFSIPTDPHQFGKASIVIIALVHTYRQGRVHMPASMQTTGRSTLRSSCQRQLVPSRRSQNQCAPPAEHVYEAGWLFQTSQARWEREF